jgi:hypothetical protein
VIRNPIPTHTDLTLLLGHTDSSAPPSGCLGVLTPDTKTPIVSQSTMSPDLLQSLEIFTEFAVDTVGENLVVLAIDNITLTIKKPCGNLVLSGVLDDSDDALKLFGCKLTSTRINK